MFFMYYEDAENQENIMTAMRYFFLFYTEFFDFIGRKTLVFYKNFHYG